MYSAPGVPGVKGLIQGTTGDMITLVATGFKATTFWKWAQILNMLSYRPRMKYQLSPRKISYCCTHDLFSLDAMPLLWVPIPHTGSGRICWKCTNLVTRITIVVITVINSIKLSVWGYNTFPPSTAYPSPPTRVTFTRDKIPVQKQSKMHTTERKS